MHFLDPDEVDEVAVVAAHEEVRFQLLLRLRELAPRGDETAARVIFEVVSAHFDIADFPQIEPQNGFVLFDGNLFGRICTDIAYRAFHLHEERPVLDGLDDEVHGAHLIALNRILCHVGHKHDLHAFVDGAKPLRRIESVDVRHLDVHEYKLPDGCISVEKLQRVRENFNMKLLLRLCGKPIEMVLQSLRRTGIVFHDSYVNHDSPSPSQL